MILYETNLKLLGGHYVPAVAVPYVWMEVDGKIPGPLGLVPARDTADGLGDILVYPFMLGWVKNDFKYDLRLGHLHANGRLRKGPPGQCRQELLVVRANGFG